MGKKSLTNENHRVGGSQQPEEATQNPTFTEELRARASTYKRALSSGAAGRDAFTVPRCRPRIGRIKIMKPLVQS